MTQAELAYQVERMQQAMANYSAQVAHMQAEIAWLKQQAMFIGPTLHAAPPPAWQPWEPQPGTAAFREWQADIVRGPVR